MTDMGQADRTLRTTPSAPDEGVFKRFKERMNNMKQVWYVAREDTGGAFPSFFDTKMAAEAYAKYLFPDESESKRYNRIFYREVFTMSDLNGG
jgi:hypothetical protein